MFLLLAFGYEGMDIFPYPYFSISVSLNILLALMIVTRLVDRKSVV